MPDLSLTGVLEMREFALVALSAVLMATLSLAQVQPFPAGFKTQTIATNGTRIFVRVGGHGPAGVALPRVWEAGGKWAPPAAPLAPHPPPIVAGLPRVGRPSPPAPGRDKKTPTRD